MFGLCTVPKVFREMTDEMAAGGGTKGPKVVIVFTDCERILGDVITGVAVTRCGTSCTGLGVGS